MWSSIYHTTALGILFWDSKFNHIGFKLLSKSISEKDWLRGEGRWYLSNFKVNWLRLTNIIDYLIINNGGYCKKYNNNPINIKVPISFKNNNYTFAIYNSFCIDNDNKTVWHFVHPRRNDKIHCNTCSNLQYA